MVSSMFLPFPLEHTLLDRSDRVAVACVVGWVDVGALGTQVSQLTKENSDGNRGIGVCRHSAVHEVLTQTWRKANASGSGASRSAQGFTVVPDISPSQRERIVAGGTARVVNNQRNLVLNANDFGGSQASGNPE